MKRSLAALPLPDTISVHGLVHAQGALGPAVDTNSQQRTSAVKSKGDITALEQQPAAQSAVTAARLQQASSLTHAVQNKPTASGTIVMPGQQAASRLPVKPAGLPFRAAGAKIYAAGAKTDDSGAKANVAGAKPDAAGAKTDAAGAQTDAAGAKADVAGAKTDPPTLSQSQDDPIITATSPSISPANANASPAKSETAQQPDAEQSQEAAVTATPDFDSAVRRPKPHSMVPLFDGGDFDAGYNNKYKPVEFVTPPEMQKAVLEAVITGTSYGMRHDPLWTHASCLIGSLVCM